MKKNKEDRLTLCYWVALSTSSPCSAEQVSTDGPIEHMKRALLASHLQLARSLNLWHVLAGTVNKLKLPLQANPAPYMSSQLWTCYLFLYGIFKSIEKLFYPLSFLLFLFFPFPISWTPAHRQIIQAFSDLGKKNGSFTGSPFVKLMLWGKEEGEEGVQAEGTGNMMAALMVGAGASKSCPPSGLCYSPERWKARQDLINDQVFWMSLCKLWQNTPFYHKFKAERREQLSKGKEEKRFFCSFPPVFFLFLFWSL